MNQMSKPPSSLPLQGLLSRLPQIRQLHYTDLEENCKHRTIRYPQASSARSRHMTESTEVVDRFRSADGDNLRGVIVTSPALTLFYDSTCPLCVSEMRQLISYDRRGQLKLVDIHSDEMDSCYPMIDKQHASDMLHASLADGTMLYGLDVTSAAWGLVGKHRWLKLLRLPVIRIVADAAYRVFARYRYDLSALLTGRARCESCSL